MRPANLLPSDLRESRRRLPTAPLVVMGAGVAVGMTLAGGFVVTSGTVKDRQTELDALRAQLAAVPRRRPPVIKVSPEVKTEQSARMGAVNEALGKRVAWDRVLRQVSQILPEDVWLKTLTATSPNATGAAAVAAAPSSSSDASSSSSGSSTPSSSSASGAPAQGLVFDGYTYSQEGVARLLSRLALIPDLENVRLQKSSTTEIAKRQIVDFTIAADVRVGGSS